MCILKDTIILKTWKTTTIRLYLFILLHILSVCYIFSYFSLLYFIHSFGSIFIQNNLTFMDWKKFYGPLRDLGPSSRPSVFYLLFCKIKKFHIFKYNHQFLNNFKFQIFKIHLLSIDYKWWLFIIFHNINNIFDKNSMILPNF